MFVRVMKTVLKMVVMECVMFQLMENRCVNVNLDGLESFAIRKKIQKQGKRIFKPICIFLTSHLFIYLLICFALNVVYIKMNFYFKVKPCNSDRSGAKL